MVHLYCNIIIFFPLREGIKKWENVCYVFEQYAQKVRVKTNGNLNQVNVKLSNCIDFN